VIFFQCGSSASNTHIGFLSLSHPLKEQHTSNPMARDKGKGPADDAAQAAAAEALEVSTAAGDGGAGAAPAAAAAPSPFGLASRADYRRAASVPLGWSCLVTNQVRERENGGLGGVSLRTRRCFWLFFLSSTQHALAVLADADG
jgi:hypothetical protein